MTTPRLLAASGLLALSLTGCGAGLDAQTYQTRTVGDASNVDLGPLAVRNIAVDAPAGGFTYPAGADATGEFRVVTSIDQGDTLLEITSDAAAEVVVLQGGAPTELEIPPSGSTEEGAGFVLRELTRDLITGEYVTLTFRFERAGTFDVLVPVATNGRAGRPALTGEPGSQEGEPALQGPTGGHSEKGAEGGATEGGATEGGATEGGGGGAERGQGEQGQADTGAEISGEGAPSEAPAAEPSPAG